MWTCPKCSREFKRNNQSHYCGKAPETVEAFIAAQPLNIQPRLQLMHQTILSSSETPNPHISWSMPTYGTGQCAISFSAGQKQISLYAGEEAIRVFHNQLTDYKTNKSAIYFPYEKDLPVTLIQEIARWCLH